MIKLTMLDNSPIWINAIFILGVSKLDNTRTKIFIHGEDNRNLTVTESVEEVLAKINEVL